MLNANSFQYALENTQVIVAPERRIDTFGTINFRFYLISELMDRVDQVRVRDGEIHAERPQIMTPGNCAQLMLEGFGEKAREFADWLERQRENMAFLKYGFQFRKSGVVENVVTSQVADVVARVRKQVRAAEEPYSAIIQGVDDGWEVSLLKFTMDLVQNSAGGNMGDLRRQGLI